MKKGWIRQLFLKGKLPSPAALLCFAGALGIFMLIGGNSLMPPQPTPQSPDSMYANERAQYTLSLEEKLTDVISQMAGVGKTSVAITLEAGEETVYAQDERISQDGKNEETRHILMNRQNSQQPLVEMVWEPEIRGIAVVCEGADDVSVNARITEAVSVLTGVSTNRISITKMS